MKQVKLYCAAVLLLILASVNVMAAAPKDNGDGTLSIEAYAPLGELKIKYGDVETVKIGADESVTFLAPAGGWESVVFDIGEEEEAPVQKDQVIGSFKVTLPDGSEKTVALVALEEANAIFAASLSKWLPGICAVLMVLIIILITYLILQYKGVIGRPKWQRDLIKKSRLNKDREK